MLQIYKITGWHFSVHQIVHCKAAVPKDHIFSTTIPYSNVALINVQDKYLAFITPRRRAEQNESLQIETANYVLLKVSLFALFFDFRWDAKMCSSV